MFCYDYINIHTYVCETSQFVLFFSSVLIHIRTIGMQVGSRS